MAKNVLRDTLDTFRYYGLFSGSYFSETDEQFNGESISSSKIYLGAGEREIGLMAACRTAEKLSQTGKTDVQMYTVMGGHNWCTWRQLYVDFVLNELWS